MLFNVYYNGIQYLPVHIEVCLSVDKGIWESSVSVNIRFLVLAIGSRAGIYWFRYRYGSGMYWNDTGAGYKQGKYSFEWSNIVKLNVIIDLI